MTKDGEPNPTSIIFPNEILWPHPMLGGPHKNPYYDPFGGIVLSAFNGSARWIRVPIHLKEQVSSKFPLSYYKDEELDSDRSRMLAEEIVSFDTKVFGTIHALDIEVWGFVDYYLYAVRHKLPLVWRLERLIGRLHRYRDLALAGTLPVNNIGLLSAFILLLESYTSVNPFCLSPADTNKETAQRIVSELCRTAAYLRLSESMRRLGFQRDASYMNSLDKAEGLARKIATSSRFLGMLELSRSAVSVFFGPVAGLAFGSIEKLLGMLSTTNYIPPIYEADAIEAAAVRRWPHMTERD